MTAILERAAAAPERPARRRLAAGLVLLVVLLAVACVCSIALGARSVAPTVAWDAIAGGSDGSPDHVVVVDVRVPRTLLGLLVGAGLGLSGVILQGVTRNPLADPGIMGVNAGAAAFIVTGTVVLGAGDVHQYIWLAFVGAGLATAVVYGIAAFGRDGATPVKLALAGAAVTAGLSSLTSAIVITDTEALNELRLWQVGSLAGRYESVFWQVLPFLAVGIGAALLSGRTLNGFALGEEVATGLGQHVRLTRLAMFGIVAVLCGAATAACGPITFLGLVVPHIARLICGADYTWILAYSLVLTPTVLLAADTVGRLVLPGSAELDVGVVLGVLGAPVFILLVRHRTLVKL